MRIAYNHQAFSIQEFGGVSRYYSRLADKLFKQGQDVKIFAGMHRNNYLRNLPKEMVKGIKFKKYPPKSGRIFHYLNSMIGHFQIKSWKPDIIHETYYSSLPTFKSDVVRITSVYDMIHELFSNQFLSSDTTTLYKKKTIERTDHIISISHSTKNDLMKLFGVEENKISVVHLGIDLDVFMQPKVKNQFEEKPYILYVGSRHGYKNFNGMLKACAASNIIKNKIMIIAFGGGDFTGKELLEINKLGFKDKFIQQVGGSDETLVSLYSNALCFVYPSFYEGFGLPPLEAMAAECPVVSSNTSSIPEVINKAGVYFDPNNIDEMCSVIETVVCDESLRSRLVKLGLENIKLFSWEKCAFETLKIYKNLTGKI
jgi:glycosyltransferase involved in cell wall biosynthesis